MTNTSLIKKPIITEKAAMLSSLNKYVFWVEPEATSAEIKKALKKIYNVDVLKVNVINTDQKAKSYRGRYSQKNNPIKKVIVTIKEGQTIDIVAH